MTNDKQIIAEGYYRAVAVPVPTESGKALVQWGKAATGTKQVLVHFLLLDEGVVLPWLGFLTPDALERTLQSFRYMGMRGDDLYNHGELDNEVSVTVEHTTTEKGKTYARIAWVSAPGGGGLKMKDPMTTDEIRHFAAAIRHKFQAMPTVVGKRVDRAALTGGPAAAPKNGGGTNGTASGDPRAAAPRNDDWARNAGPQPGERQPGEDDDKIPF